MGSSSIFNFLRRPSTPPAQTRPGPAAPPDAGPGRWELAVAPGLTVEMKLRGRHPDAGPDDLQSAENRLAELQPLSRQGRYSGHPEEMLEDIEHLERAVQRLRDA